MDYYHHNTYVTYSSKDGGYTIIEKFKADDADEITLLGKGKTLKEAKSALDAELANKFLEEVTKTVKEKSNVPQHTKNDKEECHCNQEKDVKEEIVTRLQNELHKLEDKYNKLDVEFRKYKAAHPVTLEFTPIGINKSEDKKPTQPYETDWYADFINKLLGV